MNQATIDRAAREAAAHGSHADFILKWDKLQSNPETAKRCPAPVAKGKAQHGALGVSGDGQWLICCDVKCDHREGIPRD